MAKVWVPGRCKRCIGWIKPDYKQNKANPYCVGCAYHEKKILLIKQENGIPKRFKKRMRKVYLRIFKFKR